MPAIVTFVYSERSTNIPEWPMFSKRVRASKITPEVRSVSVASDSRTRPRAPLNEAFYS